jgi:hypothetical protein
VLQFRELEFSALYAGLGVQLVDEYASVPALNLDVGPLASVEIELDIDEGGGNWRALDMGTVKTRRSAAGILWFPWLEHYRDATGMLPRSYRVRVHSDVYVPLYEWDTTGVEQQVFPYDDVTAPGGPANPLLRLSLLPSPTYPFADGVPVISGVVLEAGVPAPDVLVSWSHASLQTDRVLTDEDGEFRLPLRRAPRDNTQFPVEAITPSGGPSGFKTIRIPQDQLTFLTITIS